MNEDFITDGKEFFIRFETPLVRGYMPVPIPKGDPVLHWNGPKIDLIRSWYPALKFMQDHLQHEVILRFFMPRDRSEILVFPLSQIYGTGMTVKEEISKEEREWWAVEGMIEAGSVHSHCKSAAFASGTDTHDEKTRDGLHLTVGKLGNEEFDLHSRMVWTIPGEEKDGKLIRASATTVQKPDLSEWFLFPDYVNTFLALEPEIANGVIKYLLCKPPGKDVTYPKPWDAKLIERPTTPASWNRHGEIMPYDTTKVAYPMYGQTELSMADDIPGHGTKKKAQPEGLDEKRERENQNPNGDLNDKASALWDCWSEAMELIATMASLRKAKVRVGDFVPAKRVALFMEFPDAIVVWEDIERMLGANGLTEDEFFNDWGNVAWPETETWFDGPGG